MDVRTCLGCGVADTDPKHQHSTGEASVFWHLDCHAAAEPPCQLCALVVSETPGAKGLRLAIKGDKLRAHLVSLPPREWTHHPDGSVSYVEIEA